MTRTERWTRQRGAGPVAVAGVDVVDELVVEGQRLVAGVAGVDPEPAGYVVLSVEVAHQLLTDAGWTYEGVMV